MKGLQITPGKMQYIKFTPVKSAAIVAKQKVLDYTVTFLPKNPLVAGAVVELSFPSDGSISLYSYSKLTPFYKITLFTSSSSIRH